MEAKVALEAKVAKVAELELELELAIPRCPICLDRAITRAAACGHSFCELCMMNRPHCSICRVAVSDVRQIFV